MIYEGRHELKAERLRVAEINILREPYAIVRHSKRYPPILRTQADSDLPLVPVRKGMFQCVREELIDDKTAGDSPR